MSQGVSSSLRPKPSASISRYRMNSNYRYRIVLPEEPSSIRETNPWECWQRISHCRCRFSATTVLRAISCVPWSLCPVLCTHHTPSRASERRSYTMATEARIAPHQVHIAFSRAGGGGGVTCFEALQRQELFAHLSYTPVPRGPERSLQRWGA